MQLMIMGCEEARRHVPEVPTLAIRIYDSPTRHLGNTRGEHPLAKSDLYTILGYCFDDYNPEKFRRWRFTEEEIEEQRRAAIVFNGTTAEKILTDYRENSQGKEALLVHCHQGLGRSPAVAIALNDIFGLGHDGKAMKRRYQEFLNTLVYDELMRAADRLCLLQR